MQNRLIKTPFIIADVGSNWRRYDYGNKSKNKELAFKHIEIAANCGVSAVKFQLFTHKELYGFHGQDTYSLPREWIPELRDRCIENKVEFMCTAFSVDGLECVDPFVNIHKLASAELMHVDMLEKLASFKKPLIMSTGASWFSEIEAAFQYVSNLPVYILECVASYPAREEEYNLSAMREYPGVGVGISDHTMALNCLATTAAGMGAIVYEKHFDAFPDLQPSPDFPVSIGPRSLQIYCSDIESSFRCQGDGSKVPLPSEKEMVARHNRRLKVIAPIARGEQLIKNVNFGIYRSLRNDLKGASPFEAVKFEAKKVRRDMKPGEGLSFDDIL